MPRFFILSLLMLGLVSGSQTFAQRKGQAYSDSLLKELPKLKDDTNKVNVLYLLSSGYYNINPDKGIKYGLQGVDLAAKLGWKTGVAKLYNSLGNCKSY